MIANFGSVRRSMYCADHVKQFSHDRITRYLKGERLRPHLVREKVKHDIILTETGYLIFDDTVAELHCELALVEHLAGNRELASHNRKRLT